MADIEENSIDRAIDLCDSYINQHRRSSSRLIALSMFSIIIIVGLTGLLLFFHEGKLSEILPSDLFSNTVIFALLAIFTIVFGVMMSIYRFHLNETSKAEHYKIGFMRIRIAANNQDPGFQSEVRFSLTDQAFSFQPSPSSFLQRKKLESPLPGHPTSDIATLVLNKLLDKFELTEKKPGK